MRLYILLSHLGLISILCYSYLKYGEFYTSMIYLSTEKFPKTIICNFMLMIFIVLCKCLLNIFIGELRYLEVEQLVDNARAFIMDTILFLVLSKPTINGKEVSSVILIKYLSIIVILKAYHLVLYSRVSHIFELGVPRTKVLVKLFIFMCLLSAANFKMFTYFYRNALKNSTMYLWLFFESISIFESCQISICKFFVNIIDLRSPNGLSSKATILFFLDMLHDIMSLIIFLVFILVFVLNNFSNLPLHMTADIIHVVKTLVARFKSFQRYRELTKNIEKKFVDATEEELKEVGTCIICRDDLKLGAKKLSCAHIFHIECLKSWFIQQQTCPICRSEIRPYVATNVLQKELDIEIPREYTLTELINDVPFISNENLEVFDELLEEEQEQQQQQEQEQKREKEVEKEEKGETGDNQLMQDKELAESRKSSETKKEGAESKEEMGNEGLQEHKKLNESENVSTGIKISEGKEPAEGKLPVEDTSLSTDTNENIKEKVKMFHDMCNYYKDLCLFCLKEIDKMNYSSVPASVMLRTMYTSVDYNGMKNIDSDEAHTLLNKLACLPQMDSLKDYLEKILITEMKYTNEIAASLM